MEFCEFSELRKRNSRLALRHLRCCPARPGGGHGDTQGTGAPEAAPARRSPSCSPSPLCSSPPPSRWMSLRSRVPKTIDSREQSSTKKGRVARERRIPWKPPPFQGSLGEARLRGAWPGGGEGHRRHDRPGPENAGLAGDLREPPDVWRVRRKGWPGSTGRAGRRDARERTRTHAGHPARSRARRHHGGSGHGRLSAAGPWVRVQALPFTVWATAGRQR